MARQWYVVADSGRARFFATSGGPSKATEIDEVNNEAARKREQDLVTDRPGRTSSGPAHSHPLGNASARDHASEQFAHKVAQLIETAHYDGKFDRLTLVAPAQFLGLLRKNLSTRTSRTVKDEFVHDYVNDSAQFIRERLQGLEA